MNKEKHFVLLRDRNLKVEYPEQRSDEAVERFLRCMKASGKKSKLSDKLRRERIKAMCLQKI